MRIEDLIKKDVRIFISATGAGAGIQQKLWEVPGISKVLEGAEFPYSADVLFGLIGYYPEQYCSEDTAIDMALKSYWLTYRPGQKTIGLGLSASVTSVVPHRGEHRVWVARADDDGVRTVCKVLEKRPGKLYGRSRDGYECDKLGLDLLLGETPGDDATERAMDLILKRPFFDVIGTRHTIAPKAMLPGAFNPPHDGHFWMSNKFKAVPSITIDPPHKPKIGPIEIMQRFKMLCGLPLFVSKGDQLFTEKSARYPETGFVIGADTLERMLDPKWGVSEKDMFKVFEENKTTFAVVDRDVNGVVKTAYDFDVPRHIFLRFKCPDEYLYTSSTKIREQQCQT